MTMTMTRPIPTTKIVAIGFLLALIKTALPTSSVTAFQLHEGLHHGGGSSTKSEQRKKQHSRHSRLVIHPKEQINHDEKHPISATTKTNDSTSSFGGSVVAIHDRAKECAQNIGKYSLEEVQDLKDGLHRERLHNYMIRGSPSMEDVLLEEELDKQLKLYKDLLQSEETSLSSSPLPEHNHQQLFPQAEEGQKEVICLDEFMKELQPHLKDRDDGDSHRHRSSPVLSSSLSNYNLFRRAKQIMLIDESESMIVMKESILICFLITVGFLWTPTMTPS